MHRKTFYSGNAFNDSQQFNKWLVVDLAAWSKIGPRQAAEEYGPRYTRVVEAKLSRRDAGDTKD